MKHIFEHFDDLHIKIDIFGRFPTLIKRLFKTVEKLYRIRTLFRFLGNLLSIFFLFVSLIISHTIKNRRVGFDLGEIVDRDNPPLYIL